jgi:hypothetical protein
VVKKGQGENKSKNQKGKVGTRFTNLGHHSKRKKQDFWRNTMKCFGCGGVGHISRDCPNVKTCTGCCKRGYEEWTGGTEMKKR